MTISDTMRAPFPWFGGKRRAAPLIWQALGDPAGYVEPFAGSAAVLLARPGTSAAGWRRVETLNDADGWLVNAWRAIRSRPAEVAEHAGGPVTEIDYHARLAWLQERRGDDLVSWLEGDPETCDPKAAGWWLYVCACGIGNPFDPGPWRVVDGHLTRTNARKGIKRGVPHLGDAGKGIKRELPHLGNAGKGINRELHRLAARLQRVRITCGDWQRVTSPSVVRAGAGGDGSRAVFLDPPYATSGDLYHATSRSVTQEVEDWCIQAPGDLRIVLCGYDTDHDALLAHGWTKQQGKATNGGYSGGTSGHRERLWLSPACISLVQGVLL